MLCCLLVEKEFSLHFFLGLTLRGKNVVSTYQPSFVSVGTENSVLTELASLSQVSQDSALEFCKDLNSI